MLNVWKGPYSRPTVDIDLLGKFKNDVQTVTNVIRQVCTQEVDPDGMTFYENTITSRRIIETASYEGVRIGLRGQLGSAIVSIRLDVAFGDAVIPCSRLIQYPTLLNFGVPIIEGYSKESTIAEKFQIMTNLKSINSRLKDFFDIWLLAKTQDFEGPILSSAIRETFRNRRTQIPTNCEFIRSFAHDTEKLLQWNGFLRKNLLIDTATNFHTVLRLISTFLNPVTEALHFDVPFSKTWLHPGPWK